MKTPRNFNDLSEIDYSIFTWDDHRTYTAAHRSSIPLQILSVSFAGNYSDDDSVFLCGVIQFAREAWDSNGFILDLTKLVYGGGDMMQNVLNAGFDDGARKLLNQIFHPKHPAVFPVAVIVSDLCGHSIRSLIYEQMNGFDGTICYTEDEALNYIQNQWLPESPG